MPELTGIWWKIYPARNEIWVFITGNPRIWWCCDGGKRIYKGNKISRMYERYNMRHKNIEAETKSRIYKAMMKPRISYIAETWPNPEKTKQLLETTEVKVLRKITGWRLCWRQREPFWYIWWVRFLICSFSRTYGGRVLVVISILEADLLANNLLTFVYGTL